MSPQDLGVLLRQLWLYTRLAPLGRQLVQMAFVLLCCSFTGARPRILVPPNSIATTLEDLEAGQGGRQEAGGGACQKKAAKHLMISRVIFPSISGMTTCPRPCVTETSASS